MSSNSADTAASALRDTDSTQGPRFGKRLAAFNRRVTNHLTRPLARQLPGFGVVLHIGRKSKREYSTPVNVFHRDRGYVIALTYGSQSDWVRNVQAAGGCDLLTRGKRERLTSPRLIRDESRVLAPPLIRPALRFLRVADFLLLEPVDASATSDRP